ncbi:MAG TPA: SDR family NAD(P)-dependent oxidoreductase [Burkholderiales bacterium]|nr:SDR family NAD(P)-dependent oxidoreductase [Burkholderiales bacterium]
MATYPELNGRVAVITGGAQGIGAATARAFAAQGAKVAVLDIDGAGAKKVADALTAAGGRAVAIHVDVTDEASVGRAIASVATEFGGLDVLVNCAGGYGRLATVEDMPVEEWDRTIALNLRSVFLVSKAAIPHLKCSRAGRIINVSSISGRQVTVSSSPAYGSAKAAVIQLTRFLAQQLGPDGITSNAIAPITTLTPRVAALRTEAEVERIAALVPLKRLAEPEDHAQAMLFLASDAAAYLNGVTLDVNGGRVMM